MFLTLYVKLNLFLVWKPCMVQHGLERLGFGTTREWVNNDEIVLFLGEVFLTNRSFKAWQNKKSLYSWYSFKKWNHQLLLNYFINKSSLPFPLHLVRRINEWEWESLHCLPAMKYIAIVWPYAMSAVHFRFNLHFWL